MSIHEHRAQFVEAALNAYGEETSSHPENEGYLTVAGDMIADILHVVAARTGLDPADVIRAARFGIGHFAVTNNMSLEDHLEGDIGPDFNVEISVEVEGKVWTSKTSDPHLDESEMRPDLAPGTR